MRKLIFFSAVYLIAGRAMAQTKPMMGFTEASSKIQAATEQKFDAVLSAKNVDQYMKDMSARPHHIGSPGGKAVAEYILNHFKGWGYDATRRFLLKFVKRVFKALLKQVNSLLKLIF